MFKKIFAIVTAAVIAALIVTFVPGAAPKVQASTVQVVDQSKHRSAVVTPLAVESVKTGTGDHESVERKALSDNRDRKTGCKQAWPYYEESCLRARDQSADNVRVVRVIAIDLPAHDSLRHARH
jgi:hypothetical protein